jgi:hypothetical protein
MSKTRQRIARSWADYRDMAIAYYSTIFDVAADDVWRTIRAFDHYSWAAPELVAQMEDDARGDQVGGIRVVRQPKTVLRQRLLALSDVDRSYTYEFAERPPVQNYRATIKVTPVTEGNRAFVEWRAEFDCDDADRDDWIHRFTHDGFAVWLGSLARHLGTG